MEAAFRRALAKGEVGIIERRIPPTLKDFAQRFIDHNQVRCANKPHTVLFYANKLARLLEFDALATASLDRINKGLIATFVQRRSKEVSTTSVNRELATLRRLLRLAHEWGRLSACRIWQRRFQKKGFEGLRVMSRRPIMIRYGIPPGGDCPDPPRARNYARGLVGTRLDKGGP